LRTDGTRLGADLKGDKEEVVHTKIGVGRRDGDRVGFAGSVGAAVPLTISGVTFSQPMVDIEGITCFVRPRMRRRTIGTKRQS
jgi:hypothetical protein